MYNIKKGQLIIMSVVIHYIHFSVSRHGNVTSTFKGGGLSNGLLYVSEVLLCCISKSKLMREKTLTRAKLFSTVCTNILKCKPKDKKTFFFSST